MSVRKSNWSPISPFESALNMGCKGGMLSHRLGDIQGPERFSVPYMKWSPHSFNFFSVYSLLDPLNLKIH